MTGNISLSMTFSEPGGLSETISDNVVVEAVDRIKVRVPQNSIPVTVDVHSESRDAIQVIFIKSDFYTGLSFQVDDEADVIAFDKPMLLSGPGQIALLRGALNRLTFTNVSTIGDRNVVIVVGRTMESVQPVLGSGESINGCCGVEITPNDLILGLV
jgi:hypothetical protein